MFISAVIPLYNKEKTIRRAVQSVLNQTCQSFELIIVDDGSNDDSFREVSSIQDDRIQIILQENRGVSAARNKGVSLASSPLVAFLDADDEWKPDFLESMENLALQYPDCVLYGAGYEVLDSSSNLSNPVADLFPAGWSGVIPDLLWVMSKKYPFNSSSVVITKLALEKVGGFPEGVRNGEDVAVWLRCSVIGNVAYINLPLAVYHQDMIGRSSLDYDWRQEPYPVTVLNQLVREHAVHGGCCSAAADFNAKFLVKKAEAHLMAGEPFLGILALLGCLKSNLYRKKILPILRHRLLPAIKKAVMRK